MAASGAVVRIVMGGKRVFVIVRLGGIFVSMSRALAVMMMVMIIGMSGDMLAGLMSVRMGLTPRRQQTVSQVQQHRSKGDEFD
jgi:hypothetical protein